TWLLYWPCTWSIALAAQPGGLPDVRILALFGAGAFFMRGAGCIINDMWDKDFDSKVERTKSRPLSAGEITQFQALVFLGSQLSCALAILLQLNLYSIVLGASSMILVVLYPLAKRFTYWPQFVLGLTLNWGVLLAWSAIQGCVDLSCLSLYAACTLYTVIYDTIYSHQDKYDDLLIGVKSTAIRLGEQTKPVLSAFTGAMAAGLVLSGTMCDMTWPYYLAVAVTTGRLAQQIYTVDLEEADDCANAFRGNFYLGAAMFIGIVMSNYLKGKSKDSTGENEEGSEGLSQVREDSHDELTLSSKQGTAQERQNDKKDTVMFMPR
ncbi:4-hydroxybenzoate polyprenyltransferase, mitochondrial, partial [Plakobranchus ocellatus]